MLSNIHLVAQAAKQLGITPEQLASSSDNLLKVGNLLFSNRSTPFNSESIAYIYRDKSYTYQILENIVPIPETFTYLDPYVDSEYQSYIVHSNYLDISADISKKLQLPVVIKKNRGSFADNVFLASSKKEILEAITTIFNQKSKIYDYIALAQEYIKGRGEYRAIVADNSLELVYKKQSVDETGSNNKLNPRYWTGSKAIHIDTSSNVFRDIERVVKKITSVLSLQWAGIDLIWGEQEWVVIEINSMPNFDFFIKTNDEQLVIDIYKKMITKYLNN